MTYSKFLMWMDAFIYAMNNESEEGKKENHRTDEWERCSVPQDKEHLAAVKEKLKKHLQVAREQGYDSGNRTALS